VGSWAPQATERAVIGMTGMTSPEIQPLRVNLPDSACNPSSEATVSHIKRNRSADR
jgi:hypothetical protein